MSEIVPENPKKLKKHLSALVLIILILVSICMFAVSNIEATPITSDQATGTSASNGVHLMLTLEAEQGNCIPMPCEGEAMK